MPEGCFTAASSLCVLLQVGREGHVPGADLVIPTFHHLPQVRLVNLQGNCAAGRLLQGGAFSAPGWHDSLGDSHKPERPVGTRHDPQLLLPLHKATAGNGTTAASARCIVLLSRIGLGTQHLSTRTDCRLQYRQLAQLL